jgi:RNA polymerase sigma factor (sigma-70 family)
MIEVLHASPPSADLAARLAAERPRLVSLCARLSGDVEMAEDLAQETLAEGWRLLAKLRQPEGLSAWLSAIARNICLRWGRERRHDSAHTIRLVATDDNPGDQDLDTLAAEDGELTIALEREELVALLDRALALLPIDTRAALVGTYMQEVPPPELATRLGLSEGALRVRLHRGRLALRRALSSDLRDEACGIGLPLPDLPRDTGWRKTRIWCPFCGQHTIEYHLEREEGGFIFRCTGRCIYSGVLASASFPLMEGLSSPKALLTRHCLMLDRLYRDTLSNRQGLCPYCGGPLDVEIRTPDFQWGPLPREYGVLIGCPRCAVLDASTAWHLILDTLEAQRFWRRHPRMRALPVHEVEAEGRPALVSGFESSDGQARVVIVSDRETYHVLRSYGEGSQA